MLSAPVLSTGNAVLTCTAVTCSYVGSLYLFAAHRIGGKHDPSYTDDKLILHRIRVASLSTISSLIGCSGLLVFALRHANSETSVHTALSLLGILPSISFEGSGMQLVQRWLQKGLLKHYLPSILLPLLSTSLLYLGPLYTCALDKTLPFQKNFDLKEDVWQKFTTLAGVRTYIMGPLTEEVVFRSCILGVSLATGMNRTRLIFWTPAYFSIAHAHHAWERYVREGRTKSAFRRASLGAVLQMAYTAVFGWYANFLFLRSGDVISPVVAHVFCNIMSLPDIRGAEERHPRSKILLRVMHATGIIAFFGLMGRVLEPSRFGGSTLWI